jgi:transposase
MNDNGELVTIRTIRHWLLEEWDVSVTPAPLKKRLKKLGFRWGKKHGKDVCIA